jgi:lipopolysaccharide transport system permease protein
MIVFLSPVFFPSSALPEGIREYIKFNPLTFIIEQSREVLIWGYDPDFIGLVLYTLLSIVICSLSYLCFNHARKGFSDVL